MNCLTWRLFNMISLEILFYVRRDGTLKTNSFLKKGIVIIAILLLSMNGWMSLDWNSSAQSNAFPAFDLQIGKEAQASSEQNEDHAAKYAIDGDPSTRWAADGSDKPQWLEVDLGKSYEINSILTSFEFNDSYYQYILEVSMDGEKWE